MTGIEIQQALENTAYSWAHIYQVLHFISQTNITTQATQSLTLLENIIYSADPLGKGIISLIYSSLTNFSCKPLNAPKLHWGRDLNDTLNEPSWNRIWQKFPFQF